MLFNSLEFIIFLPVVWLLYWFAFRNRQTQNLFVIAASYLFYGWWDSRFLLLIVLTSLTSFASGLLLERAEGNERLRKVWCISNVTFNLLILGIFKYYNFFVENLQATLGLFGIALDGPTRNIILPVGISFYTFQALSYTIDVYKRRLGATHDIVAFFAYISFFPQLVAGPIERSTKLLPQFATSRTFDYAAAVDGCRQMLCGFFKKLVVADLCGEVVNSLWDRWNELSGINLILIGFLYCFQIYGDFSGYSDIAIGCGRLFGINLSQNFNLPYFARSIPDFWRRWHISLTSWLTDYIYYPLGGSRCSKPKALRNVFIVWGLSGLWHGAAWTFIVWGLYHAVLVGLYRVFDLNPHYQPPLGEGRKLPSFTELRQMGTTFLLVAVGLVFFRSHDVSQALHILWRMVSSPLDGALITYKSGTLYAIIAVLTLTVLEWIQRDKAHVLQFTDNSFFARKATARLAVYATVIISFILAVGKVQTFIYFHF